MVDQSNSIESYYNNIFKSYKKLSQLYVFLVKEKLTLAVLTTD